MKAPDPVELTAALVRCPSVTPEEGGAITLLQDLLGARGWVCRRADRGGIANLHARFGSGGPVFGFNGHTDVVPLGDGWTVEPFGGQIIDGKLYGRGAADMKSGVAAFVSAACAFVERDAFDGSVAILITGDEEGDGVDGTAALLDWMAANGEQLDVCLVGEPTCPATMGEMMKIGRRGSVTCRLTYEGVQGHAAYPHRANNPIPAMAALLDDLSRWRLDEGSDHFDASTLAVTTVDVGNPATNVIPREVQATVNIRFNDLHTGEGLRAEIAARAARFAETAGLNWSMTHKISGESFLTEPGAFSALVAGAVEAETGVSPALSTSGGTSDARFIQAHCPVVEFGLVGATMHKSDEHVAVADIEALTRVYGRILQEYFG